MKRFSLNTKRASKVLALALVAAMVVPSVPAQKSDAASLSDYPWADVPEAIASESFDDADSFTVADTTGKALKFTEQTLTKEWNTVSSDGETLTGATFSSVDKVPEMKDGKNVYVDIDVTPEVVTDGAISGSALSLKDQVSVVKYPAGAPNTYSEIQSAKTYYSGVQVANPFAAYRDELYDASRYSFEKVAATATEVERKVISKATDGWEYDDTNATWPALRNRYSAPEAKAGVTISFWAQVPYDEKAEAAAQTNFFEFSNTESLIYSTDDMAKVWIAKQYAEAAATGTADNADSPFYIGDVVEATVVAVDGKCAADFAAQTKGEFNAETNNKFKYLANFGAFMKWNPKATDSEAAISKEGKDEKGNVTNAGQYKVYAINSIDTKSSAKSKEIVVDSGLKDAKGNTLYYHLKWSDTIYAEGAEGANRDKFLPTDDAPVGAARTIQGATGWLFMASNQTQYMRDNNGAFKTGVDINEKSSNYGKIQNGQANTHATVQNSEVAKAAEDEEWHYYTVTLTDEWFQVYVDGVACDPDKAVAWNGNTFNLGSSMFKPNGKWVNNNARSDYQKLNNDDWVGSIYGQLFGESVMSYITDENTKLYIGGKTQVTAAGTRIDSMAFYTEAFTREQAAAEYAARKDAADSVPVMLGDVDNNGKITAEDALAVLKAVVGAQPEDYVAAAADVDKNGKVTAEDALAILKHVVGSELIPQ